MSYSTSPDQDDYYGDTPKRKSAAGRKLVRWNRKFTLGLD